MGNYIQMGKMPGYLVTPEGDGPWPVLIVIQEWWGLDEQTKSIADRFAAQGYLVFSPDVYHGELAPLGDGNKAMQLMQKYGSNALDELLSMHDALIKLPQCNGKIGSVGFCFGGRMSLMIGINRPLNAICTFYGGGMQQIFNQLKAIHCPVLGLFGDKDVSIPVGTVEQFDTILGELGIPHEVVVYPNSGHAFFRDSDPDVYIPEASRDAWQRVTKLFQANLK